MTENSRQYFDELKSSGALSRLELEVFAAVIDIGPVHNLRLLEYLQQKEAVNKRKADRIEWTRSNCWPRVTSLTSNGHLIDLGAYRVTWGCKVKTLHVRSVKYGAAAVDPSWEKVETSPTRKTVNKATQSARVKASQAGRNLQACRKRKRQGDKKQLTFDFER